MRGVKDRIKVSSRGIWSGESTTLEIGGWVLLETGVEEECRSSEVSDVTRGSESYC